MMFDPTDPRQNKLWFLEPGARPSEARRGWSEERPSDASPATKAELPVAEKENPGITERDRPVPNPVRVSPPGVGETFVDSQFLPYLERFQEEARRRGLALEF